MARLRENKMIKQNQTFIQHLISVAPDEQTIQWLKDTASGYSESVLCGFCKSPPKEIIIDTKCIVKCGFCGRYSEIKIDKIHEIDYNKVRFINEEKIIEILLAGGTNVE